MDDQKLSEDNQSLRPVCPFDYLKTYHLNNFFKVPLLKVIKGGKLELIDQIHLGFVQIKKILANSLKY